MGEYRHLDGNVPAILDVVALLTDHPAEGLVRGQVGTLLEHLNHEACIVEFSDDQGRAYAIVPCSLSELLLLRWAPQVCQT